MGEARSGHRIRYDRFWGTVLLAVTVAPRTLDGGTYVWQLFAAARDPVVKAWLAAGTVAGVAALAMGFAAWRSRTRHLLNFALGVVALALPVLSAAIWEQFPHANPALLPLGELGSVGWVMMVALIAIYAGSGMRIARPTHVAGQSAAGMGALLLGILAFLPIRGAEVSYGVQRVLLLQDAQAHWRELVGFGLVVLAAVFALLNLLRTRAEVQLARLARLFLVGAVFFRIGMPIVEKGGALGNHVPVAWDTLRLLAPLFLALDAASAYVAASITRTDD